MKVESILLIIQKLKNDVDIAEIKKKNLFATNIKKAFILKNSLNDIIRQVSVLRIVPYKGRSLTRKFYIFLNKMFFRRFNQIMFINN